jgi:hypothetical protein
MEVVMTIAIFAVFMAILVTLTVEMRKNEQKYPVNFMTHPEVAGVIARLRKDIFDTLYYPHDWKGYEQTGKTLILYSLKTTGFGQTVVYDFQTAGEVHRKEYNATDLTNEWVARGVPSFQIYEYEFEGKKAVRIKAFDDKGKLAIDEIFVPRPHDTSVPTATDTTGTTSTTGT